MAPPPKHVITRKLIKRYFKRFLPKAIDGTRTQVQELKDCYSKHGVGSEKCNDIVEKLNAAYTRTHKARSQYRKLDIESQVMSALKRPVYPFHRKGRYRDLPNREKDIYDGIF